MLQCDTRKAAIMKKRFTIMLEERTILMLKKLASKRSPIRHRKELERVLYQYALEELNYYEQK